MVAGSSSLECSTHRLGAYIVIHRQTVSIYHNSPVLLGVQDASSWDQNPADFTSVGYLTPELSSSLARTSILTCDFTPHNNYNVLT